MGSPSLKECVSLFYLIPINISSLIIRSWRPILSQRYVLFVAGFKQRLQIRKEVGQSASAAICHFERKSTEDYNFFSRNMGLVPSLHKCHANVIPSNRG